MWDKFFKQEGSSEKAQTEMAGRREERVARVESDVTVTKGKQMSICREWGQGFQRTAEAGS
jgi:hypothetical protein